MQRVGQEKSWLKRNNSIHRHTAAFVLAVLLVVLFMQIPIDIRVQLVQQITTIEIELSKVTIDKKDSIEKPPIKTVKQIPAKIITKPTKPKMVKSNKPPVIKKVISSTISQKETTTLPSSGAIFNMTYGKIKQHQLDKEFKARSEDQYDYIPKVIEQPEWYLVSKLIDEEVDKPRTQMDFYSEGIVGSVERFLDKITRKKKYTTKYGTVIECSAIAIIAGCSW